MKTKETFDRIMAGEMTFDEIKEVLVYFHENGVSADDLAEAAMAMREASVRVASPEGAVDIVGTGGDGFGTFNVSTTAAFIAAGAGATVAKHGNRASTSKSGAADCLGALGYNLEASVETIERSMREVGIGFLFANKLHPAMRYAAPVRKALPFRTIFNLLGPLTNPCGVRRCALGVYSREIVPLYIGALKRLGTDHAVVFSGPEGLDELGLSGVSFVSELFADGEVREYEFDPKRIFGGYRPIPAIAGGSPEVNAVITRTVLSGDMKGAYRNAAILNAAAALVAAEKAKTLEEGVVLASASVDMMAADTKFHAMIASSAAA